MPEGLPIGAVVTDVTATDDDIGENARLVFTLDSSSDASYFYFDSIFNTMSGALKILTVREVNEDSIKIFALYYMSTLKVIVVSFAAC